jgi:hypothetical protein
MEFALGSQALTNATDLAVRYVEKARQYAVEDVQRCQNYLMAAGAAIKGLEKEYDQILVQAKHCQVDQPEQVRDLQVRIDNYLTVDELRPELFKAITGLEEYQVVMQRRAERFLQWPWAKANRREAITEFVTLLQSLRDYFAALDEITSPGGPTGVGASSLLRIAGYLQAQPSQEGLVQLVSEMQADRTKAGLMEYTSRIERTINVLLKAFR